MQKIPVFTKVCLNIYYSHILLFILIEYNFTNNIFYRIYIMHITELVSIKLIQQFGSFLIVEKQIIVRVL